MYMQYYAYNCVYAYCMYDYLDYMSSHHSLTLLYMYCALYILTYVCIGVYDNAYYLWRGQERAVRIVSHE